MRSADTQKTVRVNVLHENRFPVPVLDTFRRRPLQDAKAINPYVRNAQGLAYPVTISEGWSEVFNPSANLELVEILGSEHVNGV